MNTDESTDRKNRYKPKTNNAGNINTPLPLSTNRMRDERTEPGEPNAPHARRGGL